MVNIIDKLKNAMGKRRDMTVLSYLDSYIADCESGRRLHQRKKMRLADGTINAYRNLRVALRDFEAYRKQQFGFNDMTMIFFDSFFSSYSMSAPIRTGRGAPLTPALATPTSPH